MNTRTLNRRHLLRGAGGIGIGLPLLSAMIPRRVRAADALKRFVVFYTPNGSNSPTEATGTGSGATFTLGQELAPLLPIKDKVLVVDGINNRTAAITPGAGANAVDLHALGMTHMLTGTAWGEASTFGPDVSRPLAYAGGISVDQQIAKLFEGKTRFPSLEFGVQSTYFYGAHPFTRMSYLGPGRTAPPEEDPLKMFNRMFMNGGGDVPAAQRIFAQRKSVLDFVGEDYTRLAGALGSVDRSKLQDHLASIREIEKRLQTAATIEMSTCQKPTLPSFANYQNPVLFPDIGKAQMDLLTLALACDMTRVASIQWSSARSQLHHVWLNHRDSHHGLSHGTDDASIKLMLEISRWYGEQLAYLAMAMNKVQEPTGTLLDNTVIYYCSEVSTGATHGFTSMRTVLVGGCGGTLRTGRVVSAGGKGHNHLLVSLLNAMGDPANTFGDAAIGGSGPLSGLTV